jgi:hypothetical protein
MGNHASSGSLTILRSVVMIINSKVSFHEYRKLLFGLTYKKPVMKLLLGVAGMMVLWILSYSFHLLPLPKPEIYQYLTLILILVVQPLVIYWTIKRNFDSSTHLGQHLELELTPDQIKIRGECFYTEIRWKNLFRIEERKHWFLLYQNNLSAIIIPKKDLTGAQQEDFEKILATIPDVPIFLIKKRSM